MLPDLLNVSILSGSETPDPDLLRFLQEIPQIQILLQTKDPGEVMGQMQGAVADLVMVYLNGDDSLPRWLATLTATLPQTAVLLCSQKIEPDFLLEAMRQGVKEVVPLPLNREDLESAMDRVRASRRRLAEASGIIGKILSVTGNKGGAGATTVAVNLSVALARSQPGRVVLVDLGRPYPDVGHFLDRESMYTVFDLIQNQANLDRAFMEKTIQPYEKNLSLVHGVADFTDQDSLNLEGLKKIFTILKSHYHWVVVDLSHWLDELFLQVIQDSDLVLMLLELTVPDLRNLGTLWPLLRNWMPVHEKVKLVINRYDRGNGLNCGNLEQVLKQKPYFTLPSDYETASEAINRGVPLATVNPKSKFWTSLEGLARQILGQLQTGDETAQTKSRRRFWVI